MKLTTMTQVTVDGVMQGNGGVLDEDRRSGFERGGWARGMGDDETRTFINQTYERADAFLFGRRTYEIFARVWGVMDKGSHPIADALNTKPKYDAGPDIALDVVDSRADSKGVTIQVYWPAGRPA